MRDSYTPPGARRPALPLIVVVAAWMAVASLAVCWVQFSVKELTAVLRRR